MTIFNIGIVGCGNIAQKRLKALGSRGQLVACADIDIERAKAFALDHHLLESRVDVFQDWRELISLTKVDIVIISTLHNSLAEITLAAVNAGKHVLVEKPAARFAEDLAIIMKTVNQKNVKVRVGFNHRYHRSLQKAKELVDSGVLGELMFIRARYGHGGRLGYDKEWRANPKLSGGGELIDQGPHLIDLSRWFFLH